MLVQTRFEDLNVLTRVLGVRVSTSKHAPRPGVIFNVPNDAIIVHPDEEHMVWASIGEIGHAFDTLDRTVKRQIAHSARRAEGKLHAKTAAEIRNEVDDELASYPLRMSSW